jgi:hypothetical protein
MRGVLRLAVATCCLLAGAAHAQFPPGGGRPPSGGAPPGRMPPMQAMKVPSLEELAPPDPLRLWHGQLIAERDALALDPDQAAAFDAWMRELKDLVTLNERRLWAVIGRSRQLVSARADIAKELNAELEAATDRVRTLEDLVAHWQALNTVLSPAQRDRLTETYLQSRMAPIQRVEPR